jgi:hypothetical protein
MPVRLSSLLEYHATGGNSVLVLFDSLAALSYEVGIIIIII